MSYFKKFPFVDGYIIGNYNVTGIDITRRTGFTDEIKNDPKAYIDYTIKEGETPEMLADRIYDDPGLAWIILMFNTIHNVYQQWPMDSPTFYKFLDEKYGKRPNNIHHYESISSGAYVDSDHPEYDRKPVTNYEYEEKINEGKKRIRILHPELTTQAVQSHDEMIEK